MRCPNALLLMSLLLSPPVWSADTPTAAVADSTGLKPKLEELRVKGQKLIQEWIPFFGEKKPSAADTDIYQAVLQGSLEALREALEDQVNINDLDTSSGLSALHLAVKTQRQDLVEALLNHHADIQTRAAEVDDMPLHIAARLSDTAITRLLLNRGANVDAITHIGPRGDPSRMGDTALHEASRNSDEDIARLLIENNANVQLGNRRRLTPLHLAAEAGNVHICKLLLDNGANIDHPDRIGATPLHLAVKSGKQDVVQLLLDRGAQVDAKSRSGTTPLFSAVAKGYKNITSMLIEAGADANSPGRKGETPWERANKINDLEILKRLKSSVSAK